MVGSLVMPNKASEFSAQITCCFLSNVVHIMPLEAREACIFAESVKTQLNYTDLTTTVILV